MKNFDLYLKEHKEVFKKWSGGGNSLSPRFERLTTWPEGISALKNWTKNKRDLLLNSARKKNSSVTTEDKTFAKRVASGFEFFLMRVQDWQHEAESQLLTPKDRVSAIERVKSNAEALLKDIRLLALPTCSTKYFTQQEVYDQYTDFFAMMDMPGELEKMSYVDMSSQIKEYLEFWWPSYRHSILTVDSLLRCLTDSELLNSLSRPQVIGKIDSETSQRVYLVRAMTDHFCKLYGKKLEQVTANFCAVFLNDASIDRSAVRSALTGYKPGQTENWTREESLYDLERHNPELAKQIEEMNRKGLEKARKRWRETGQF